VCFHNFAFRLLEISIVDSMSVTTTKILAGPYLPEIGPNIKKKSPKIQYGVNANLIGLEHTPTESLTVHYTTTL